MKSKWGWYFLGVITHSLHKVHKMNTLSGGCACKTARIISEAAKRISIKFEFGEEISSGI
jgi:hypothetical protein